MHSMSNRISTIELGMTDCSTTVNDIIDAVDEVKEEQDWVRAKLADLENTILYDVAPRDIIIDRIHRIAKPSHLAPSVPRDVLIFSTSKKKLCQKPGLKLLCSDHMKKSRSFLTFPNTHYN